jgi:class 3 adenylate cyclase
MTVTTGKRDETQGFHLSLSPISVPTLSGTARCEVTLLFSDLRGYSAFTEESDVAEVAAVMGLIKDEATRIVREHGGLINQFVGDEVVAIFGFPTNTDDDTRRAVNAAIEMHALVRSERTSRSIDSL